MSKGFAVIGDIFVDIIAHGVSKLPQWSGDARATSISLHLGGSAVNTASWIRALGNEQVEMIGVVGEDAMGKTVKTTLQDRRVGIQFLCTHPTLATSSCIVLSGSSDRAFVTANQCNEALEPGHIPLDFILKNVSHVHFASFFCCSKLTGEGMRALFREMRRNGITVSMDPQTDAEDKWDVPELWEMLKEIDIFLPNSNEACLICRESDDLAALAKLCRAMPQGIVVMKRGELGAVVGKLLPDGSVETIFCSAPQVPVVDTTGAGDGFNGGFLHLFNQKRSLKECLAYGCKIGSLAVTKLGAFSEEFADLKTIESALAALCNASV